MARKNYIGVDFNTFDILKKRLDTIGGGATERAIESALKASRNIVTTQVSAAMTPHNQTGDTKDAIVRNSSVIWEGDTASIGVGFDIPFGGLPSIFLMYGTTVHGQPHIKPDRNLYNAVYGAKTRKEILKIQEEAFYKVIERAGK